MISLLAHVYVHYLEPGLKIVIFLIIGFVAIQLLLAIGDAKKRTELVGVTFGMLVAFVKNTVKFIGKSVVFLGVVLHKTIKEVYKVISDFFTSKI